MARVASVVSDKKSFVWQKNSGSLASGLMYNDIELKDLKWFPAPNQLKIQELTIDINSFGWTGVDLYVENARLILPDCEPILFFGKKEKQTLDFNFYSQGVSDNEIKNLLKKDVFNKATGSLSNIDVFVKGTMDEPVFKGEFFVEKITKNGFSLKRAPCFFEIRLKETHGSWGFYGSITFNSGTIEGKRTALVRLDESKIIFEGDPQKPSFDIHANSVVEKIKMNIVLKGTFQQPDLQVHSTPPKSRERLLLALATNKTWQDTEAVFSQGTFSVDLAKDFIDYFVFGGQGNKFAETFGLKSLSVNYDAKTKGIAVTKDLSGQLEGSYKIEGEKKKTGEADISQKIGGEYRVTDNISLGAEKELKAKEKAQAFVDEANKPETEDKIYLKYKKEF